MHVIPIKQKKSISKEACILFGAIFVEVAFIIYFSFTTKNVFFHSVSLLLIAIVTFPLGMLISRLLFPQESISKTIVISLCLGLPFSAWVWGILAFSRVPINPPIYFSVTFVLPICLLIYLRRLLKFKVERFELREICAPCIVFLLAFLWHSLIFANSNVPTDVDSQGPIFIQLLMKYQGYPIVSPFLEETTAYINYPPCFNVIVVLFSKLKMSLVYKECMAITAICGSYFALAIFLLAYFIAGKNIFFAFIAGVLTLNRAYLSQYNDGNTTEMLSFLSVTCFLILLHCAFNERTKKLSTIIAVSAGIVFSVAAFSQTEIFNWYAISFAVFFLLYLVSKDKNYFKDYLVLAITALACIIVIVPWLIIACGNHKTIDFDNLFTQCATHLIPALKYWHNPVFIILSVMGVGIFFFYRQKIMVFLGMHALIMAALIIHWKFYRLMGFKWFQFTPTQNWSLGANGNFTTPFEFPNTFTIGWMSFTIVFPIATAYTLITFFGFIKEIKIVFIEKYKTIFISMVFLSVFQYYEYKNYIRYPEWLLETDYQTLKWFHKNTTFNDCLILNPRNPIKLANGVDYWSADWVPIIAERRAISSRSFDTANFQMKIADPNIVNRRNELIDVYNNILRPGAYDILKKSNISHIFISALQTGSLIQDYQKASFLELVHYYSIPNLGTAVIYKVK
ncbi:MAG: hypothetical protein A2Y11_05990 [Planctomycetes bacterium GWC2_39_26]|nr:MAG: hypothetical protein A2Y11_05990 [Planctomycetes bacterium GWC2_39_26]